MKENTKLNPAGIGIGIAIGAALGIVLDNLAIGIGIGIAIGVAMSVAMGQAAAKKKTRINPDSAAPGPGWPAPARAVARCWWRWRSFR